MNHRLTLKLKCPSTSVNKKGEIRVVFRSRTGFYIPISLYRKIEPHPTLTLLISNFTIFNTLVKGHISFSLRQSKHQMGIPERLCSVLCW